MAAFLRRYMVFPGEHHAPVVALWVAHTWVSNCFDFTPYLAINSPLKRCGKSTLLECLRLLVREPWPIASPSPAVLFRKIEKACPTLLWDEVDTVFTATRGDDGREDLRAILNVGFQAGARVPRCVGPNHDLAEFAVFCPKALAGIGTLPTTVADRSVIITLARAVAGQRVEKFRSRGATELAHPIQGGLEAWSSDPAVRAHLTDARPEVPESLGDRQADICEPLLAIADLAGGSWPKDARRALVRLCAVAQAEEEDLGAKLLSAIRDIYDAEKRPWLPTRRLLDLLILRDDGPWGSWWESEIGRGNTSGPASRLARLLKPFGVASCKKKEDGGSCNGYAAEDFADAFARYLPPRLPPKAGTEDFPAFAPHLAPHVPPHVPPHLPPQAGTPDP